MITYIQNTEKTSITNDKHIIFAFARKDDDDDDQS